MSIKCDGLSLIRAKNLAQRAAEHYDEPCLVYRDKRRWKRKTYGVIRGPRARDWQIEQSVICVWPAA